jgi:hypothetical protein
MHRLARSANADFNFVIASQRKMADAKGFSMDLVELLQQAHHIQ